MTTANFNPQVLIDSLVGLRPTGAPLDPLVSPNNLDGERELLEQLSARFERRNEKLIATDTELEHARQSGFNVDGLKIVVSDMYESFTNFKTVLGDFLSKFIPYAQTVKQQNDQLQAGIRTFVDQNMEKLEGVTVPYGFDLRAGTTM